MTQILSGILIVGLLATPSIGQEPSNSPIPVAAPQVTGASDAAAQPKEQAPKLHITGGIRAPKPLYQPEAVYPREARKKHLVGKCNIVLTVNTSGMPQDMHVTRCSNPVFASASLAATSKYRFNPGMTVEGKPVPVQVHVVIMFRLIGEPDVVDPIRYSLGTPPGTLTTGPDADGIYALTNAITSPTVTEFIDQGYGAAAFNMQGENSCEMLLTLDAKGKPDSASPIHCAPEKLESLAEKSLMASRYQPAMLEGKPVPVRLLVHMEYGDLPGHTNP